MLPGVPSQPVIVIQLHSLVSIFPTRNEPFCSQSHVSTTIPLRPSCFLGITVSRYRKKDKMKWENPTPATDITCKIVFKLCYLERCHRVEEGRTQWVELQVPVLTWIQAAIAFTDIIYWASVWDFVHPIHSANIHWVSMLSQALL